MANELVFTILGIDKGSEAFDKVSKSADEAAGKLDKMGKVGTVALAAMPAAALAGGVATAGALGIVSAGIIGLAAVAVHNNEQIITSFGTMWQSITDTTKAAAQPLANEFVLSANKMRRAVTDLTPQIHELFAGVAPDIQVLTDGVVGFAKNAMPGFVTAVQNSRAPVQGFSSLLKDTGTGISQFFTNISHGADSSGMIMQSLGHDIRDLLGFAGSLFAQLSNAGGPAVYALEGFLHQLEGTILSLGQTAFPGLSTAAAGFLSAGSGVLRLLQLISPLIGPLIGDAAQLAVSLKLVDAVSFGGVSSSFSGLKQAMSDAEGLGGKLKAGFSNLASGPLPLLGLAAVALSAILGDLGKKQRDAAEAAQQHEAGVRKLTDALDKTSGAINDETRQAIANTVAKEKMGKANTTMADQAKKLGANQQLVVDAVLDTDGAMGRMNGSLRTMTELQIRSAISATDLQDVQKSLGLSMDDLVTIYMGGAGGVDEFQRKLQDFDAALAQNDDHVSARLSGLGTAMQGATLDSRNLWGGITDLNSQLTDAQKQAMQAANGLGQVTQAQKDASAVAAKLKSDFATLADSMAKVSEKGTAVMDILDRMSGKQPDLRVTQQAWDDLMRSMTKDTDWDTAKDGVQKLSKGLVDARGEINTTTEAGSKLLGFAQSSQTAFANEAAAMQAAHTPADQMTKKLGEMRQAFIDNAVSQGLPKDAAVRLADAYQMVPNQVVTAFTSPGLLQRITELGILNYQIVNLPDGHFEVIANTDPARGSLTKLIQDYNGRTIRLDIVTTARGESVRNMAGGLPAMAVGGWVSGPGTTTSDSVPTLLSNKEFVVGAGPAAKYASVLEAINAGRDPIMPTSSSGSTDAIPTAPIHKHYHLTVQNAGNTTVDLQAQFRRLELLAGV